MGSRWDGEKGIRCRKRGEIDYDGVGLRNSSEMSRTE